MNISFLAPAKVGPIIGIIGEATLILLGKTVAFIEGKLMDETGRLLAAATANARLVEADRAIGQARS
jgi:acyl-coenzyme A thioesterase PaaI-like protein